MDLVLMNQSKNNNNQYIDEAVYEIKNEIQSLK
jgi:hypothetical protein